MPTTIVPTHSVSDHGFESVFHFLLEPVALENVDDAQIDQYSISLHLALNIPLTERWEGGGRGEGESEGGWERERGDIHDSSSIKHHACDRHRQYSGDIEGSSSRPYQ